MPHFQPQTINKQREFAKTKNVNMKHDGRKKVQAWQISLNMAKTWNIYMAKIMRAYDRNKERNKDNEHVQQR